MRYFHFISPQAPSILSPWWQTHAYIHNLRMSPIKITPHITTTSSSPDWCLHPACTNRSSRRLCNTSIFNSNFLPVQTTLIVQYTPHSSRQNTAKFDISHLSLRPRLLPSWLHLTYRWMNSYVIHNLRISPLYPSSRKAVLFSRYFLQARPPSPYRSEQRMWNS